MIPKHFRLGRLHLLWWPLKTLRGRFQVRWDKSRDGNQVMRNLIDDAVASRFLEIRRGLKERTGDYIYGCPRTMPDQLGWRFRQTLSEKWNSPTSGISWAGYPGILRMIRDGYHDLHIAHAWHDAASAEDWYRNHKDYGDDYGDDYGAENQAIPEDEIDF